MNDDFINEFNQERNEQLMRDQASFRERLNNLVNNGNLDSRKERRAKERKMQKLNRKAA